MKNNHLKISIFFLGIVMVAMMSFVVISKAADEAKSKNPYDDPQLGSSDIIKLYHNNINEAFNNYIRKLMTSDPEDPNGKSYRMDGTTQIPLTAADCMDPRKPQNFSTYCVAINLLGANSADCATLNAVENGDGIVQFCALRGNALPLKGYLNYVAAMKTRANKIFDSKADSLSYSDFLETAMSGGYANPQTIKNDKTAGAYYQTQKALEVGNKIDTLNSETKFAKEALDQTLSAYDQLRVSWAMHEKYRAIYNNLEKYRDKLVDLRHQTDVFPKKFIDLTTTACT